MRVRMAFLKPFAARRRSRNCDGARIAHRANDRPVRSRLKSLEGLNGPGRALAWSVHRLVGKPLGSYSICIVTVALSCIMPLPSTWESTPSPSLSRERITRLVGYVAVTVSDAPEAPPAPVAVTVRPESV